MSIGIDLGSSNSEVSKNIIYDCNIGIGIATSDSVIKKNNIKQCSLYGLYLKSGRDNTIFNNTFLSKSGGYHAKDDTAKDTNKWYNESLKLGNYWDDFYGPDPEDINNTVEYDPVNVPDVYKYTTGGVEDKYPTGSYNSPPIITNPSPSHLASGIKLQPGLKVKVEDPNNEPMDIEYYYILNNTSYHIETKENVASGSIADISFMSTIQGRNRVYTYLGVGYNYICEWYVNVTDKYTKITSLGTNRSGWIFTTLSVPMDNEKPIADIGGPYTGYTNNEAVMFNGSDCYDPDGEIIFYRWIFGDGESVTNVKSSTHIYKNPGTWNISLVVIDNNGSSDTDTYTINIESEGAKQAHPVANPGGPYSGTTRSTIEFDGSGSYDSDGSIVKYVWDFGDGSSDTGKKIEHKYQKTGTYTVTLTVEDDDGATHSKTANVEIESPPSTTKDSPGFEIIFVIAAIFIILYHKKRLKGK